MIIGEGGSGGAIAIATANRVYMLEHSIYSVISPEGAASILWRDSDARQGRGDHMKITAQDLLDLKIIDGIIPEPLGGAHRGAEAVIAATGDLIARTLGELRRRRTWISASSGARNTWRWAAASRRLHRCPALWRAHFRHKNAVAVGHRCVAREACRRLR